MPYPRRDITIGGAVAPSIVRTRTLTVGVGHAAARSPIVAVSMKA